MSDVSVTKEEHVNISSCSKVIEFVTFALKIKKEMERKNSSDVYDQRTGSYGSKKKMDQIWKN